MTTRCAGNDNLCFVDEATFREISVVNFHSSEILDSQPQLSSPGRPGRRGILQALLCRNRLCPFISLHTQDFDRDDVNRPELFPYGILALQNIHKKTFGTIVFGTIVYEPAAIACQIIYPRLLFKWAHTVWNIKQHFHLTHALAQGAKTFVTALSSIARE